MSESIHRSGESALYAVRIGLSYGRVWSSLGNAVDVTSEDAPKVAARLASVITGTEMVCVAGEDLRRVVSTTGVALPYESWATALDNLRAAVIPEPCPYRIVPTGVSCRHDAGHDGAHVARGEWVKP